MIFFLDHFDNAILDYLLVGCDRVKSTCVRCVAKRYLVRQQSVLLRELAAHLGRELARQLLLHVGLLDDLLQADGDNILRPRLVTAQLALLVSKHDRSQILNADWLGWHAEDC